jgi:hypothetical protein
MPSFSTQVTEHRGGAILEVLCDQKPWGETYTYDNHFRFGPSKAHMIMAARSVIKDFVESKGEKPALGVTVIAHDDPKNPSFSPSCSTRDHFFVRKDRVDRPYLKLSVGRFEYGFGVLKAEALIELMDKVEAFARTHRT